MASSNRSKKTQSAAARGTRGGSTGKRRAKTKHGRKKRNIAGSIALFGIGVLLLALIFVPGASVWNWVRANLLFGVFGIGAYILAVTLLYLGFCLADGRPYGAAAAKALLLMLLVSGVLLIFSGRELTGQSFFESVKALHAAGAASGWGFESGVFGAPFGWSLLLLCGRPGANILMLILGGMGLMYVTGVTPADLWYFFSGKAQGAKHAADRHAEARAAARAARREAQDARLAQTAQREREEPPAALDEQAYAAARARRRRVSYDIDIGGDPVTSTELKPEERPVIGPGGTFGMFPARRQEETPETDGFVPGPAAVQKPAAPPWQEDLELPEEPASLLESSEASAGPRASAQTRTPAAAAPTPPEQAATQPAEGSEGIQAFAALVKRAAGAPSGAQDGAETAVPTAVEESETGYLYPPLSLFQKQPPTDEKNVEEELAHNAELLVKTLSSFGVQTRMLDISRGPSVTRYELQPLAGVKISKITNLADDIALNLAATGVRIEAPIPGKAAVGIEVPNRYSTSVSIRSILESPTFSKSDSPLTLALGKDIAGACQVADLTRMPHLLIAGSTGSGKSVCINTIVMSFLYKCSPEDLKLIMIDPKVVELDMYNGIPHLLMPVVTEPRKAAGALGAAVAEMERRYHAFAENNVRNIKGYNRMAAATPGMEKMPYIAIVIDELADLMMTAGKEVEDYICRIAQKARAAGMHLIVATQRPSVDVITGLIKTNIPSRIAFAVSSQIDSRTILDGGGAEKLLGMGDMLFLPVGANKPIRIQGAYVHDEEISGVLNFIKQHSGSDYSETMIEEMNRRAASEKGGEAADDNGGDSHDPMLNAAVEAVIEAGMASTSFLQRRCKLGYARAARIMDEMEQMHIIGPYEGAKPRQVLITREQWIEMTMRQPEETNGE